MRSGLTVDPVIQRKEKIERLENLLKAEEARLAPTQERLNKIKNLTQHVETLTSGIRRLQEKISNIKSSLHSMTLLNDTIKIKASSLDYYAGDPIKTGIPIETMKKRYQEAFNELSNVETQFAIMDSDCDREIQVISAEISELLKVFKSLELLEGYEVERLKNKANADAKAAAALAVVRASDVKHATVVSPPKPVMQQASAAVSQGAVTMWQPLTKERLDKRLLATSRITSKDVRTALAEILVDEKKLDVDKFCIALRDQLENPESIITKLIKHPENKQAMQQVVAVMRDTGPISAEVVKKLEAEFKDQLAQDVQYVNQKNERISKIRQLLKLDKIPSKNQKLVFTNIYDVVLKNNPNREIKLEELSILYSIAWDVADLQQQWYAKKMEKNEDMTTLEKIKKMSAFDDLENLVQKSLLKFPLKNMDEVIAEIKKILADTHVKDGIFSKEKGIKAGPMDLATKLIKQMRDKLDKNYVANIVKLMQPVADNKMGLRK